MVEILDELGRYRFLLVGENRSLRAIKGGWSWETCQRDGPRLCAIQLFGALENVGIDPRDTKIVTFVNVWGDDGKTNNFVVSEGQVVVAMGNRVSAELVRRGVTPDLQIPHPAARGRIRNPAVYCQAVRDVFCDWLSSRSASGV